MQQPLREWKAYFAMLLLAANMISFSALAYIHYETSQVIHLENELGMGGGFRLGVEFIGFHRGPRAGDPRIEAIEKRRENLGFLEEFAYPLHAADFPGDGDFLFYLVVSGVQESAEPSSGWRVANARLGGDLVFHSDRQFDTPLQTHAGNLAGQPSRFL